MVWRTCLRVVAALIRPISMESDHPHRHPGISDFLLCSARSWPGSGCSLDESATFYETRTSPFLTSGTSMSSLGHDQQRLTKGTAADGPCIADARLDLFKQMKQRFLSFKNHEYLKEREYFQALAQDQFPKFMVIACADSRVCPSNILRFRPGEAFMIRNVANLVPPAKNGPTETNAALEFAVTNLQVEHIFVIGHSSCAGIQTLMQMKDNQKSSLVENWVATANTAKLRTKALAPNAGFDEQCSLCEKESINGSLMNLLTYPWIEDRVKRGLLSIHGGYYDFRNCTFQKWTLHSQEHGRPSFKDAEFWS